MLDRELLTYKGGCLQQEGLVSVNMHPYYCMCGTLDVLCMTYILLNGVGQVGRLAEMKKTQMAYIEIV